MDTPDQDHLPVHSANSDTLHLLERSRRMCERAKSLRLAVGATRTAAKVLRDTSASLILEAQSARAQSCER